MASLRGSVCSYQGEELGLTEADIAYDDLQDPYGINFWPTFKGRDGCRTPMPWDNISTNAGFSTSNDLWLPVTDVHTENAVEVQENDKASVLIAYRTFLTWRKMQSCLLYGDIKFIESNSELLVFTRQYQDKKLMIIANFTSNSLEYAIKEASLTLLSGNGFSSSIDENSVVTLPAFNIAYLEVN